MRSIIITMLLLFVLNACSLTSQEYPAEPEYIPSEYEMQHESEYMLETTTLNFVDERVELISLIFRLSGLGTSFLNNFTDYHFLLMQTFDEFRDHPAVVFIYNQGPYFVNSEAFALLAVHLEKQDDGFVLIGNIELSNSEEWALWTSEKAEEFVTLLNDFYSVTNFHAFFQENTEYFQAHTERFIAQVYANVNHEWFAQHGIKRENMHPVIMTSIRYLALGPSVLCTSTGEIIAYAMIPSSLSYNDSWVRWAIIHEYAHSIANPIADSWYAENEEFRRMVHESRISFTHSFITAREYITDALVIWYKSENCDSERERLLNEFVARGYTYMHEVFDMVSEKFR
ncbi:MAG: DUF4932 domain-containing protein [Defluviitaleaceae bacterium]|nr:DUF4932 domain-containing protein [Defluviitaleaceae bacterium]